MSAHGACVLDCAFKSFTRCCILSASWCSECASRTLAAPIFTAIGSRVTPNLTRPSPTLLRPPPPSRLSGQPSDNDVGVAILVYFDICGGVAQATAQHAKNGTCGCSGETHGVPINLVLDLIGKLE